MAYVATLGAAYSANKGAASMLQALIDNLPQRLGTTNIVAVSTHPGDDRSSYERAGVDVRVASQRPAELALLHLPLAMLAGALRVARLPWRWVCRPSGLRALADADVVADISGISFVDGRKAPYLIYNTLLVLVPLLLGRPVVKCSQAMGPFRTRLNRLLAKLVLPRLHTICPRGASTEEYLREFGRGTMAPAADLAFTMRVPDEVRTRMRERLAAVGPGPYLVVSPSQVVQTSCERLGIDYQQIVADFITDAAAETGRTVVLIAHSAQPNAGVNHMNDLPLCREIYSRLSSTDGVVFLDEDLLPTELRAVIGEAELLVTSRFHAMISALGEHTPLLVIGWSHKYAEVLAPFDLEEVALTYEELTGSDAVLKLVTALLDRTGELAEKIRKNLPDAIATAQVNFAVLEHAITAHPKADVAKQENS